MKTVILVASKKAAVLAPPPDPTVWETVQAIARDAWRAFNPVHWFFLLLVRIDQLPLLGQIAGYGLVLAGVILAAGVAIRTAVLLGEAALIGGLWFVDWASGMLTRVTLQLWATALGVTILGVSVALWPLRFSAGLVMGSVAGLLGHLRSPPEGMPDAVKPTGDYAWALEILGLQEPFTQAEFKQKARGLQSKVHPDHGEMPKAFAQQVNLAVEVIRKEKGFRR